MKKEKSKKTEVITFRTSPDIKQKLEEEAELRDWPISQLVERIIASYVNTPERATQNIQVAIHKNGTININGG